MKPLEQSEARRLYAQGVSRKQIAATLNVSRSAVTDWTGDMLPPKKTCPVCKQPFRPKRTNSLYCGADCKIQRDNEVRKPTLPPKRQCKAPECDVIFQPTNPKHVYCSVSCRNKDWYNAQSSKE